MTAKPDFPLAVSFLLLILLTAFLFGWSLTLGAVDTPALSVLSALLHDSKTSDALRTIVWQIRLPRTILATAIGAILGMSGAALQGYLRNPLAEPGLIGVSSGAALGAVAALYSGLSSSFALALPLAGLAGALIAVIIVYVLAGARANPLTLILAGIAISSFAGALTSLALNLSPSPFAALEIVFWMMGSLADRSMDHVTLALPFIVAGLGLLALTGRALDALTLGEDVAETLGINLRRTQAIIVMGVAIGVGAAVSVSGVIGFVGLVAPHLLRPLARSRPGVLLFLSALGGACLLLGADSAVRLISPGQEMKLGVLTALIGGPFFLMLIMRARKQMVV